MSRERQLHFSRLSSEWTWEIPPEVRISCLDAFSKTSTLWRKLSALFPEDYDYLSGIDLESEVDGRRIIASAGPRIKYEPMPKIKDLDIPDELKEFFELYGEHTGKGKYSYLPGENAFEVCLNLYGIWPLRPGIDIDSLHFLPILEIYDDWAREKREEWLEREPAFMGTWAHFIFREEDTFYQFFFSKKRHLVKFIHIDGHSDRPEADNQDIDLPHLETNASFRGNSLYSLWTEGLNGTFFPDPRGDISTIWPHWVRGTSEVYDRNVPGDEAAWEKYTDRVRKRKPVISGKTGKYVLQTERQALKNLHRWRLFIYYKIPQALHFYKNRQEPGFKSKLGYRFLNRHGFSYIPKKDSRYFQLSGEQTAKLLSNWDPASTF